MSVTTVYKNQHLPSMPRLSAMFTVRDAPQNMVDNIGRKCWLKLVRGMANPHGVNHRGTLLAPAWEPGSNNPTDRPRLFEIVGLQHNYKAEVCYRIHMTDGDSFGRCAHPDEVIIIEDAKQEDC